MNTNTPTDVDMAMAFFETVYGPLIDAGHYAGDERWVLTVSDPKRGSEKVGDTYAPKCAAAPRISDRTAVRKALESTLRDDARKYQCKVNPLITRPRAVGTSAEVASLAVLTIDVDCAVGEKTLDGQRHYPTRDEALELLRTCEIPMTLIASTAHGYVAYVRLEQPISIHTVDEATGERRLNRRGSAMRYIRGLEAYMMQHWAKAGIATSGTPFLLDSGVISGPAREPRLPGSQHNGAVARGYADTLVRTVHASRESELSMAALIRLARPHLEQPKAAAPKARIVDGALGARLSSMAASASSSEWAAVYALDRLVPLPELLEALGMESVWSEGIESRWSVAHDRLVPSQDGHLLCTVSEASMARQRDQEQRIAEAKAAGKRKPRFSPWVPEHVARVLSDQAATLLCTGDAKSIRTHDIIAGLWQLEDLPSIAAKARVLAAMEPERRLEVIQQQHTDVTGVIH
ncbi:hypothetical protein DWB68_06255 [Galactobacter valiniphilus]|uniref:Uncharacterized protein n=1 Tax=Galactobacter valiniphilus TaxID=2676122 RepID=A0A399JEE6_9MICC|nr:hypothetical protein [Galactobacter valiniphilus]RII42549.1 hypothetical protein DWB68_06255 [Galactobacter valiniphilus]